MMHSGLHVNAEVCMYYAAPSGAGITRYIMPVSPTVRLFRAHCEHENGKSYNVQS